MKEHSPHSPQQQDLEQHEVQEVLRFLKRYGKLIGIGVLAAAATVLISSGIGAWRARRTAEAEQRLMQAQTAQQIEAVVNEYSSTPAAPIALLELAKQHGNAGRIAEARQAYSRFLNDYKDHELRATAEFGLAFCTEADGNSAAAADQYRAFADTHTASHLYAPARIGTARCLAQAGQTDQARIILEDFLAEAPGSAWSERAETLLQRLTR